MLIVISITGHKVAFKNATITSDLDSSDSEFVFTYQPVDENGDDSGARRTARFMKQNMLGYSV